MLHLSANFHQTMSLFQYNLIKSVFADASAASSVWEAQIVENNMAEQLIHQNFCYFERGD